MVSFANTSLNVFMALLITSTLLVAYYKLSSTTAIINYLYTKSYAFAKPLILFSAYNRIISKQGLNFTETLAVQSSSDKFIILVMADYAFREMAMNMYETSFKKHGIKNFLFVANGVKLCEFLNNLSVPCFHYTNDSEANSASPYGSAVFIRKMNVRTYMILDALRAGFTVLHSDVDVVFLQNPLPELKEIIKKADMAILKDGTLHNSGFLVIKPTNFSIKVYEATQAVTDSSPRTDDQRAMNDVIPGILLKFSHQKASIVSLDSNRYLYGAAYFEKDNRRFPAPACSNCVVVHNNWIVSMEAKVYRFKEHLHWMYDGDAYYTSQTRKYISYDNPIKWNSNVEDVKEELYALRNALAIGTILNRTVILPRFHCSRAECPLNSLVSLITFDKKFGDKYRESSFLQHPLVPASISSKGISSRSSHLIITRKNQVYMFPLLNSTGLASNVKLKVWNISNSEEVKEDDIRKAFGDVKDNLLEFRCLYGVYPTFSDRKLTLEFEAKINDGFYRRCYRQLDFCI